MKKIICAIIATIDIIVSYAQNYTSGPLGLYGPQYNAATTIASGGNVLVGNSGNWFLAGNITSADKGNPNSPGATGRSEAITFSGTGTYSNASSTIFIDGYAGVVSPASSFVLPIGTTNPSTVYAPVTLPANSNTFTAAYFYGSGSITPELIMTTPAILFSPYIDAITTGITTGSYTLTYPAGFSANTNSYIVGSTDGGATYTQLAAVSPYNVAGGTVSASMSVPSGSSLIAFATSQWILLTGLLSFDATPVDNSSVLLNWSTATEINDAGFYIERSSDAGVSWSRIGFVPTNAAGGNSNTTFDYHFADQSPANGINYYRLQQVDIDGISIFSYIVHASIDVHGAHIKIYPNPAVNQITANGVTNIQRVDIYDMDGRKVISKATNDQAVLSIDISHFSPGTYILFFYDHDGKIAARNKFIKVNQD